MIRALTNPARTEARRRARRLWRTRFVPIAVLNVERRGRVLVVGETLETRWSQSWNRRLWRTL